jgi:hypothetical protein
MDFLIGQRVIVNGDQIAKVIPHPIDARDIDLQTQVWVVLYNGVKRWYGRSNVKPLPGGQL